MDPGIIWLMGTLLATLPIGHALMRDCGDRWWVYGIGWVNKPDGTDWTFAAILAPLVSFAFWPGAMLYVGVRHVKTRKKRQRLKAAHRERQHKEAFKKLKEAKACLLEQKRTEHRASTAQWTAEFEAADVRRIEAVKASRLAYDRRLVEQAMQRKVDRIERERMYSDAKGYETIYCQHGNSLDYPCSHCLF